MLVVHIAVLGTRSMSYELVKQYCVQVKGPKSAS